MLQGLRCRCNPRQRLSRCVSTPVYGNGHGSDDFPVKVPWELLNTTLGLMPQHEKCFKYVYRCICSCTENSHKTLLGLYIGRRT